MPDEKDETKNKWEVAGVCVPAGLLIGMGIGMAVGQITPGLLIGLGAGFLGMMLVRLKAG